MYQATHILFHINIKKTNVEGCRLFTGTSRRCKFHTNIWNNKFFDTYKKMLESDFVLASYTFGCCKMSDFVPNNRHLRVVLIFFFHSKKTAAEAHRELQKSLRRCCKWNNVLWLVPSLQRQWFRCWRPSPWRKANNLRRRWCYLLWAIETERNHHRGTVSNAIDAFEPRTARKTDTIRLEARKSDSTAWQR